MPWISAQGKPDEAFCKFVQWRNLIQFVYLFFLTEKAETKTLLTYNYNRWFVKFMAQLSHLSGVETVSHFNLTISRYIPFLGKSIAYIQFISLKPANWSRTASSVRDFYPTQEICSSKRKITVESPFLRFQCRIDRADLRTTSSYRLSSN